MGEVEDSEIGDGDSLRKKSEHVEGEVKVDQRIRSDEQVSKGRNHVLAGDDLLDAFNLKDLFRKDIQVFLTDVEDSSFFFDLPDSQEDREVLHHQRKGCGDLLLKLIEEGDALVEIVLISSDFKPGLSQGVSEVVLVSRDDVSERIRVW